MKIKVNIQSMPDERSERSRAVAYLLPTTKREARLPRSERSEFRLHSVPLHPASAPLIEAALFHFLQRFQVFDEGPLLVIGHIPCTVNVPLIGVAWHNPPLVHHLK